MLKATVINLSYILIIVLIFYIYKKSILFKHWKIATAGLISTFITGIFVTFNNDLYNNSGYPFPYLSIYNVEQKHLYEKFSFDLVYFLFDVLFWAISIMMILILIKAISQKFHKKNTNIH